MAKNQTLVYGRMTGWGQDGSLAMTAGHDPNYIGIAGALSLIGDADGPPVYPLNLIGDFGGGALYLAMGMLAALLETSKSGKGQVVDTAMVDGVASMLTYFYGLQAAGIWNSKRGTNILDGGSHFAHPYRTQDGEFIVIAALEGRFYQELLDKLDCDDLELRDEQMKRKRWPEFQEKLQSIFLTKTREQWCEIFEGSDTCFSPVLNLEEATQHEHAKERSTYVKVEGITQPAPAPRFSRTPGEVQSAPPTNGKNTFTALSDWGFSEAEINQLKDNNVIGVND
jgi:alpha-methylacyl-CoA racemase